MNRLKIKIWGRFFDLYIDFDGYEDSEITKEQKEALETFKKLEDGLLCQPEPILKFVKAENEDIDLSNIFKYVMPHYLYVPDKETKEVILMCDYKFDMEQGLAVVYCNGKITQIAYQCEVI